MIRPLVLFVLFIVSFFGNAQGRIVETSCMRDILKEIDEGTIVFFDIDETLVYIPTMMGSGGWWVHCNKFFKNKNWDTVKVHTMLLPHLQHASLLIDSELVDPDAPQIIKDLKKRGNLVYGLTARSRKLTSNTTFDVLTKKELSRLGISFSKAKVNLPSYTGGIIYTSGNLKGPYLEEFLLKLKSKKRKVVFIDDNWKQIYSVDAQMAALKIPTVCFRYSKADNMNQDFDPLVANIQLKSAVESKVMLTNEQAQDIANNMHAEDVNFYLKYLYENDVIPEVISPF